MVKFVIAGPVSCGYFAKIEVQAQTLKKVLPDFNYRAMLVNNAEWKNFVEETCRSNGWQMHKRSPLIWREPLDFGGPKLYFGGFNEFQEYAKIYYDLESHMTSCEMLQLADANTKNRLKETVVDYSGTTHIVVSVIFASSPICTFLTPHLAQGSVFSTQHLIHIRFYDTAKSQEVNRANAEALVTEIENCSYPNVKSVCVVDTLPKLLTGAHVVLIFPAKTIIEDLLHESELKLIGGAIVDHAEEDVKVMVVYESLHSSDMNICNLRLSLTLNLPYENIIAVTGTIQQRGARLLAEKLNIHPTQISNLLFWAFNSKNVDSFIFDINFSTVENCINSSIYCPGVKSHLSRLTPHDSWLQKNLPKMATAHLNNRPNEGSLQNAMSLASTAAEVLKRWWNGSGGSNIYCVCIPSLGSYNLGKGIFFMLPVLFKKAGDLVVVDQLPLHLSVQKKISQIHQRYVDEMLNKLRTRAHEVSNYVRFISTEPFGDAPSSHPPSLNPSVSINPQENI